MTTTEWVAPCAGATIGELIAHFNDHDWVVNFLNKFPWGRRTAIAITRPGEPPSEFDVTRVTKGPLMG